MPFRGETNLAPAQMRALPALEMWDGPGVSSAVVRRRAWPTNFTTEHLYLRRDRGRSFAVPLLRVSCSANAPARTSAMGSRQLDFVTGNRDKFLVVKAILGDAVNLQSQSLDLVEIQGTIEEISAAKCREAADTVCFFEGHS